MDVSADEVDSERESRARGKKPRIGRGRSAQREDPEALDKFDVVEFENSGMEQVDEVEEVRREWQRVMGPNAQIDELLDAEVQDVGQEESCNGVQDVIVVGEVCLGRGRRLAS